MRGSLTWSQTQSVRGCRRGVGLPDARRRSPRRRSSSWPCWRRVKRDPSFSRRASDQRLLGCFRLPSPSQFLVTTPARGAPSVGCDRRFRCGRPSRDRGGICRWTSNFQHRHLAFSNCSIRRRRSALSGPLGTMCSGFRRHRRTACNAQTCRWSFECRNSEKFSPFWPVRLALVVEGCHEFAFVQA